MKSTAPVIISLTSYSERINVVHKVIASLKEQNTPVDKIILWLDETELTHEQLPKQLSLLEDELFEINFCANYKSYKKLVPTLKAYPTATIITFDDDIVLSSNIVGDLLSYHQQKPKAIIAARGRVIRTDEAGAFLHYGQWPLLSNKEPLLAPFSIVPIGYGGVLYPSGSLDTEVINSDVFQSIADNADDIWFKCMALLKGSETLIMPRSCSAKYKMIEGSQDSALYLTTNIDNINVEVLSRIIEHYPTLSGCFKSPRFDDVVVDASYMLELVNATKLFESPSQGFSFFRDSAINAEKFDVKLAFAS
ncbi:hypothetical protein [Shewanella sp. 6_MG-2023]|uniref:hypothetical protein n=1 Tax=Shewanella sp. 6_MG-2023 TaxID=3062660 RepID=UPI0026E1EA00|nr:hypothetical protein [Shewanella sp. 6_MG-2023]MDO6617650.1 hypothetical protein [Shewanella sp. 6_MG-2023]